jgi:hypothetical protein
MDVMTYDTNLHWPDGYTHDNRVSTATIVDSS